tara:strand:- start:10 stop:897 length:888 start_codon:yes stop_codon:yes gene_type:complete
MKILFHDFSNVFTTEPRYLHRALEQCQIDSQIWNNPQTSVYDALDMVKPDVLVSHYQALNNDIVKYLSQSKVELALNVTGATDNVISQIDDLSNNVKVKLVYDNTYHKPISRSKKIKSDQIMPAADIFSPVQPIEQRFKLGIFTSIESKQYQDEVNKEPIHHRLHLGVSGEKDGHYDLDVDMQRLPSIIRMYDGIKIVDTVRNVCSQLFFEACLHGQNVNIIVPESEQESFTDSFEKIFSSEPEDIEDLASEIKDQIVQNHTPFHRAARLLKLLGDTEGNKKVENVKSKLQFQAV